MKIVVKKDIISQITNGIFGISLMGDGTESTGLSESPAAILRRCLIENSIVNDYSNTDWPCFISAMPDIKYDCATVYDTEGINEGKTVLGGSVTHPGIQIKVRATDYSDGWSKINSIADFVDFLYNEEVEENNKGFLIQNCTRTSDVMLMGKEMGTGRRYLFTVNYIVTIKENSES